MRSPRRAGSGDAARPSRDGNGGRAPDGCRSAPVAAGAGLGGGVGLVRLADGPGDAVEDLRERQRRFVPLLLADEVGLLRLTAPGADHRLQVALELLERRDELGVVVLDALLAGLQGLELDVDLTHDVSGSLRLRR